MPPAAAPPAGSDRGRLDARRPAVAWRAVDIPPPDPQKLLTHWMEWERGEVPPGRVLANLKTAGMRDILEQLAGDHEETPAAAE